MFDQELINKNKNRSEFYVKNSEFFQFIYADLIDRLAPIDKKNQDVLWIGHRGCDTSSRTCFGILGSIKNITVFTPDEILRQAQDDGLVVQDKKFDLICFPFGLHWVDDVQSFLYKIRTLLKSDGIFICNFPGAGTLSNLRKTLFLAEESLKLPHFPHISPFIKFDDVATLLKQAGFAENITDYEHLSLEYDSPISLMKAIKNVGESNAIASRSHYSITKSMYKFLSDCRDNKTFQDQVNLITLISSPAKHSIKLKSEYFTK